MKVTDIPKFIPEPHYEITSSWGLLEDTLDEWNERTGGSEGLDLDPDFQRGHVWTEDKQIAYVEFCLKGGAGSRTLLFNHPNWMGNYKGEMVLVDGKQRLESAMKFLRNELPVFGGNCLNDFDDPRRLLRNNSASFVLKVNNLKTRKEILQWYLDINTGGVVHTNEEIGKVKKLLDEERS